MTQQWITDAVSAQLGLSHSNILSESTTSPKKTIQVNNGHDFYNVVYVATTVQFKITESSLVVGNVNQLNG